MLINHHGGQIVNRAEPEALGSAFNLPSPYTPASYGYKWELTPSRQKVRLEASGFLITPSAHQICNPPTTIDGPFSLLRCRPLAMLGSLTTLRTFFREFSNADQSPRRANRQQGRARGSGKCFQPSVTLYPRKLRLQMGADPIQAKGEVGGERLPEHPECPSDL